MKPNYLVGPLLCLAVFGGYYVYWKANAPAPAPVGARVTDAYAARDGAKEAEAELAAGRLALIESGARVGWDAERREIARTQYGVELRPVEEMTTEAQARYVDRFNRVMRPAIIARHGRGFFDRLHQEAIALQAARKPGRGK
ncbi:MAG: hypothetical protein JNL92_16640 [Opitutaceae bacterium]|nr:hypothetical protein [Opitutaceae bacterium]